MSGVRLLTVKNWSKEVDCLNERLRYNGQLGTLTRVYCELCSEHDDKLKSLRNFSPSFVNGITGSSFKKDNVVKHSKSDMHRSPR